MTNETEFDRTDARSAMPRWLALVLASIATLLAIGVLWSLTPTAGCGSGELYGGDILPGPQPCADDGSGPALTTSGILLALLASMFVVAFTVVRRRGLVLRILGGAMLVVLIMGLLATVTAGQQLYYY